MWFQDIEEWNVLFCAQPCTLREVWKLRCEEFLYPQSHSGHSSAMWSTRGILVVIGLLCGRPSKGRGVANLVESWRRKTRVAARANLRAGISEARNCPTIPHDLCLLTPPCLLIPLWFLLFWEQTLQEFSRIFLSHILNFGRNFY